MRQEISNNLSIKIDLLCKSMIILIMLIIFSKLGYANNTKELNSDIRNVIIGSVELNIPKNFLIRSSAQRKEKNEKALLLAFNYAGVNPGTGNGKDDVLLWLEDTREYNKAVENTYGKWKKEQKYPKAEFNKLEKVKLKRQEIIKNIWGTNIPFDFYPHPDNFLTCEGYGPNPKCYYGLDYKGLNILIIFSESDLNKLNYIKQSTLKLIKQWENKNEN